MMTAIGPRELPELRQALYAHPDMPKNFHRMWDMTNRAYEEKGGSAGPVDDYLGYAGRALCTAELHYIDHRFCQLVSAAAPSLPPSPLAEHDLPTPRGLAYFADPLLDGTLNSPGQWMVLWCLMDDISRAQTNIGFAFWWFVDRDTKWIRSGMAKAAHDQGLDQAARASAVHAMPLFCPSLAGSVTFGSADMASLEDAEPGSPDWLLTYLLTTWHVQRQRLTTSRIVRPDRAALRRLAKQRDTSDPAVRVISLRTPEPSEASSRDGHEYRHQWVVRGHWRQQWYPSIADHRPVWIAPHIKGPDGAPLLGGEKVYAWQR
jgi:hypothetical protein